MVRIFRDVQRRKIPKKKSHEQHFLNNICWVPDSCHREAGRSSRELFAKFVQTWYFLVFLDFGAPLGSVVVEDRQVVGPVLDRRDVLRI